MSRELVEQYDGGEHAARRAPPRRVLEDFLAAACGGTARRDTIAEALGDARVDGVARGGGREPFVAVQFLQAAVEPLAQHGLDERVLVDAAAARE